MSVDGGVRSASVMVMVVGMLLMQRIIRAVGMFLLPARMMVTMVVVAMFAMRVLVAVVPLTVVHVLGSIRVSGCGRSGWGGAARSAASHR
ncbi:MAG TPA: hypothetical protein VGN32_17820 [Ktedonobacterales bacterium]|nr:hypothetical protein [Ktedonobacterales bacterium]